MNETILIIDDTPEIIRMIRTVLQNASYKTLIARDGIKGLSIAKSTYPDLILLDIMMPGSNGYEICKLLKIDPNTTDIPVIFISALDNSFDKVEAFSSGGADYVPKPIQDDELLARIQAQLKPATYRKELKRLNSELSEKNEELEQIIAQLKLSQQRLIESEKLASLGVLSAGITHEINNPVHFISGGIETLKEYIGTLFLFTTKFTEYQTLLPEKNQIELENLKKDIFYKELMEEIPKIIDDINTGADRIIEIIKGLGLFLYNGPDKKNEADLHEIINAALLILSGKYKNKVNIHKNFDPNLKPLFCYSGLLNQVFVNLINNAADAVSENGNIWITTKFDIENLDVLIFVKDDGCGIPLQIVPFLFDPFFTTKDVGKGTGLGLFISYEIIQKHGGEIKLLQNQKGFTEFEVKIPFQK
jgi:signal transduction histidine kinase